MVFVGDAYMTIDPILAQGFTVAMEGAYATKNSVLNGCQVSDPNSKYAFDPYRESMVDVSETFYRMCIGSSRFALISQDYEKNSGIVMKIAWID